MTKWYPVVCTAEAYHGKGISSLKRSRLRISIAMATQLRICVGPWVCVDWIWKPWALHAGSSCHQRAPEANGALLKWREGPTEVEWWGPGLRKGPKITLSVLFSSFVNQEFVLKQLAVQLKEGHLRTSERCSYPLVTHSALGWVLSCFCRPWSTNWALSGLRWSPKSWFLLFVICFFFLFVILGPSQK